MTTLAATLSVTLFLLAALHVYWAVRGISGGSALPSNPDGSPLFLPSRTASVLVAVALTAAAVIVLGRAELASLPVSMPWLRLGTWAVAVTFAIRTIGEFNYVGLFKRVRGTPFARMDTWLFTPVCAALASASAVLAAS